MTSDDHTHPEAPAADDVTEAYRCYQARKAAYLSVLAGYTASRPDDADPLYDTISNDTALLRVLHALSVGYGWSDMIYKVSSRAHVAQAQLRGYITRDESHGGMVLTQTGVETLRQWTEYVVPLADKHPRYHTLWRAVTSLQDAE